MEATRCLVLNENLCHKKVTGISMLYWACKFVVSSFKKFPKLQSVVVYLQVEAQ